MMTKKRAITLVAHAYLKTPCLLFASCGASVSHQCPPADQYLSVSIIETKLIFKFIQQKVIIKD